MSTLALRRSSDPQLDTNGVVLLDSRVDVQFAEGHIPGAIQANPLLDFVGFTTDGGADPSTRWVLLDRIEIYNRYNSLGLDRGDLAITSCRTGIAGSSLYFILKYAGFEVSLYDGSFNEWSGIEIHDDHELDIWRTVYPGYTDNDIVRQGVLNHKVEFLQKPFTSLEIGKKIRHILDSPKRQR